MAAFAMLVKRKYEATLARQEKLERKRFDELQTDSSACVRHPVNDTIGCCFICSNKCNVLAIIMLVLCFEFRGKFRYVPPESTESTRVWYWKHGDQPITVMYGRKSQPSVACYRPFY